MTDLTELTIAGLRDAYNKGEASPVAVTEAYLSAIEAANGAFNAYVAVTADKARAMARASEERLAAGRAGALEGVP
ncbi:MAG: Asp-tRNA(Asn)/Glu-tRNA(Gln) amidotransferase subunit GatA, partial [Hyphomicrobiaceae bacterium]|nr:Asp-tRNA(Asn)/Glu-tRNA(Gln) amidotransferase subunit GatA [Hyphomicrobiaceae bacterium]